MLLTTTTAAAAEALEINLLSCDILISRRQSVQNCVVGFTLGLLANFISGNVDSCECKSAGLVFNFSPCHIMSESLYLIASYADDESIGGECVSFRAWPQRTIEWNAQQTQNRFLRNLRPIRTLFQMSFLTCALRLNTFCPISLVLPFYGVANSTGFENLDKLNGRVSMAESQWRRSSGVCVCAFDFESQFKMCIGHLDYSYFLCEPIVFQQRYTLRDSDLNVGIFSRSKSRSRKIYNNLKPTKLWAPWSLELEAF